MFLFVKARWKNDEFGLMGRINSVDLMVDIHMANTNGYRTPEEEGSMAGVGMGIAKRRYSNRGGARGRGNEGLCNGERQVRGVWDVGFDEGIDGGTRKRRAAVGVQGGNDERAVVGGEEGERYEQNGKGCV
ncbi:hypothetical protein AHAS_Ahas15G0249400 [Arachis hypogaea]